MRRRPQVLAEVVVVFFAGSLAARALQRTLGLSSESGAGGIEASPAAALGVAADLLLRWGLVIGLALLVAWWMARLSPRDCGVTLAGQSLAWHLRAGAVTLAFAFLPVAVLLLARTAFDLPGGPALWNEIDQAPRTLGFWLFMMAGSIVLPPLVEELFFRGYAQTRLATAFRPRTAIVVVALLFVFAHVQYLDGSLVATLLLPCMIWQFVVIGLARWYTGSLVAPIVAHALGNIPMRPAERAVFASTLALVAGWTLLRRRAALERAVASSRPGEGGGSAGASA